MKPRDRKLIILRQLGKESEPVTLANLAEKLDLELSNRTIRRWLNQLVVEGFVKKSGHTKGALYSAVRSPGDSNTQQEAVSSCFSTAALEAMKVIKKPIFERKPAAYNERWFDSYVPNVTHYLEKEIREQLQKSGQRANAQDPAGTYAHQIYNRLMIDLSYNSSRLEGNTYSLLDTERLILHGDSAEGKLDEEKAMILNHKEAIRYLVENAQRVEIDRNTICTLHYLLSDGLLEPSEAGKVRKHGVRIGGSTYIPFEQPRKLESQLEKIAKKGALITDPYEQSIFLLVHISYLQAFADVNKRTARLSANISLIKNNFVPLAFNDVRVDDYMSAMIAIYELQDVRPLGDLYHYSYLRTCSAYDSTIKAMGFDEVRVRYRQERREVVREVIFQCLVGNQMRQLIKNKSAKLVPEKVRTAFVDDILEDLEQIDESRIVGLGVTLNQLTKWKHKQNC